MFMVKQILIGRIILGILLLCGISAHAFSFFPDKEDQVLTVMRKTDAILTQADDAYEQGDAVKAQELYRRALKRYEEIHAANPDLHEGLPRFRINHCKGQLASLGQTNIKAAEDAAVVPAESTKTRSVWSRLFGRSSQDVKAADDVEMPPPDPNSSDWAIPAEVVRYKPRASVSPEISDEPARAPTPAPASDPPSEETPIDPELINADLQEARRMIKDERLADATRILVQVLRIDPGNRSARLMISLARSRQGRYDEALVALEDLKGESEDLPLLLAFAAAHCGAEHYFDAMLFLDKAIQLAPEHPYAYYNLAWLHLAMNDNTAGRRDAEAYYRRAISLGARRDKALEVKLGLE